MHAVAGATMTSVVVIDVVVVVAAVGDYTPL